MINRTEPLVTTMLICLTLLSIIFFPSLSYSDNSSFSFNLKNWIDTHGYAEFHFYPPHNEYDPNPGVDFRDRVVARYGLELYSEFRSPKFPELSVFVYPIAFFGDSKPQTSYNYKADPIVVQIKYGVGFEFYKNLELKLTHSEWKDLGGYKSERLVWNSVSVKYKW